MVDFLFAKKLEHLSDASLRTKNASVTSDLFTLGLGGGEISWKRGWFYLCATSQNRKITFTKMRNQALLFLWKLVFSMEGFDVKVEGTFAGQFIPLLSVDGKVQGNLRNWSSAVSKLYGHFFAKREPLTHQENDAFTGASNNAKNAI